MSQSQLAFEIGSTLRHVQRIEKGETNAGVIYFYRIADALEIDFNTLFK